MTGLKRRSVSKSLVVSGGKESPVTQISCSLPRGSFVSGRLACSLCLHFVNLAVAHHLELFWKDKGPSSPSQSILRRGRKGKRSRLPEESSRNFSIRAIAPASRTRDVPCDHRLSNSNMHALIRGGVKPRTPSSHQAPAASADCY